MTRVAWFLVGILLWTPSLSLEASPAESVRYRISIAQGDAPSLEIDLTTFRLPSAGGALRVVIVPDREVPGLPLLSIVIDRDGNPRADLTDHRDRTVSDALLYWLEAEAAVPPEWRVAGAQGTEKIRLSSLRLRSRIAMHRSCTAPEGAAATLHMALEEPVLEMNGELKTELRTLDWRFELDAAGAFRGGELRRELVRSIGAVEQVDAPRIEIEVISRTALEADEARRVWLEFELLAPAARCILPGQDAKQVDAALERLERHRTEQPDGKLAAAVPRLEAGLTSRSEWLAGGTPDERAERLIGHPAPEFGLTDLDGEQLSLSSLRGKPVLLSFWGHT